MELRDKRTGRYCREVGPMKRGYEALDDPKIAAVVHLEQAEELLSDIEGIDEYRQRVTEIRSDLGSELMRDSFTELVEAADDGDTIVFDEAGESIENLSSGSSFDADEAIKEHEEAHDSFLKEQIERFEELQNEDSESSGKSE